MRAARSTARSSACPSPTTTKASPRSAPSARGRTRTSRSWASSSSRIWWPTADTTRAAPFWIPRTAKCTGRRSGPKAPSSRSGGTWAPSTRRRPGPSRSSAPGALLADRHLHTPVAQHHPHGERLPARAGGYRAAIAPGGSDRLERGLAHVAVIGLLPQRHLRAGHRAAALIGQTHREGGPVLAGRASDVDAGEAGKIRKALGAHAACRCQLGATRGQRRRRELSRRLDLTRWQGRVARGRGLGGRRRPAAGAGVTWRARATRRLLSGLARRQCRGLLSGLARR